MERMFHMCPFCHGTLKLIQFGGASGVIAYQCLECHQVVTPGEKKTGGGASYFEWLMSRPTTKRALVALKAQPAIGPAPAGASSS